MTFFLPLKICHSLLEAQKLGNWERVNWLRVRKWRKEKFKKKSRKYIENNKIENKEIGSGSIHASESKTTFYYSGYPKQNWSCNCVCFVSMSLWMRVCDSWPKSSLLCVNRDEFYYCDKIACVMAQHFCPNPNFSAKALGAFTRLLPPYRVAFAIRCCYLFCFLVLVFLSVASTKRPNEWPFNLI